MASVEQDTPVQDNGAPAPPTIAVENPATGEPITTVPVLGAAELSEMAARAREAQPQWDAIGFDGRARIMLRAQKWMLDNADRVIESVVAETGKTYEDAQLADLGITVTALGFWAKEAANYLADERVPSWNNPVIAGKKLLIRYLPLGVVGVIGPWNYPIVNSFGDCIPAMMAGNSVILKPSRGDAAQLAADGRDDAGVRPARRRLPGGHRRWRHRRGAHRRGRLRHVHRVHSDRQGGHAGGRRAADSVLPRARWQGSDDRLRRRQHRSRRQRRRVLFDEQRRPGLHLGGALLRRGARLRRVRRQGDRERPRPAPGRADRRRHRRRRRRHLPAAARHRRRARP